MLLLAVMCVACNPDSGKKKISIAYANWLEGIAMSHLAKVVLEEKGYEVELLNADVAPVFASVSRKKADVVMDAWLPVTMKDYIDQYGDQIEFIGEVYDSARVGLVVPQYVTIDSIGELAAHKGQFSSEIVGIDAGAGIMKTTDRLSGIMVSMVINYSPRAALLHSLLCRRLWRRRRGSSSPDGLRIGCSTAIH